MSIVLCHQSRTYRFGKNNKYTVVIERNEIVKTIRVHAMLGDGVFQEYVLNQDTENIHDSDILGTLGAPVKSFQKVFWDDSIVRTLPAKKP